MCLEQMPSGYRSGTIFLPATPSYEQTFVCNDPALCVIADHVRSVDPEEKHSFKNVKQASMSSSIRLVSVQCLETSLGTAVH